MDVFDLKDKLIIEFVSAAFNVFRPPSANIVDGIEDFFRSLVYQKGRGEILSIHRTITLTPFLR